MPEVPTIESNKAVETSSNSVAASPEKKEVAATPKKKAAGNKPAKKAVKKAVKKVAKTKSTVMRAMADVPAKERREAFIKLLRKVHATSVDTAKPISELASKLNYSNYDVYCLAYHKHQLAVDGLVKTAKREGERELSVYLTAKGSKIELS